MASSSNAASGPRITLTLSRSISSCALVLAPAGLPPVSAEIDLAARECAALFLEQRGDALLHLDAALCERAGLDREQADLERRLRVHGGGLQRPKRDAGCCETFQNLA